MRDAASEAFAFPFFCPVRAVACRSTAGLDRGEERVRDGVLGQPAPRNELLDVLSAAHRKKNKKNEENKYTEEDEDTLNGQQRAASALCGRTLERAKRVARIGGRLCVEGAQVLVQLLAQTFCARVSRIAAPPSSEKDA